MGFLLRMAISALGLWLAAWLVPGMAIEGTGTLVLAALLLGVVNAFVRPVAVVLTLPITIVGIVADIRPYSLTETSRRVYFPYVATDTVFTNPTRLRFVVRTSGDPRALVNVVREAVVAIDPRLPIDGIEPLSTLALTITSSL